MIIIDLLITGIVVSIACALPGLWLMLRGMSMLSDALTHSILLGIVLTFLVVADIHSPWMFVGAVTSGVVTALLIDQLQRLRLSADAAVGLVFAGMFSLAIVLLTLFAGDTHLDIDAVLLGEIIFAPFDRMIIGGVDIGPRALVLNMIALMSSIVFMRLFWKELLYTTFDATSALLVGFTPTIISTGLVIISSITVVTAFDAVGAILVVAFMTAAPASAFLLTYRLVPMVWLTVIFAITSAILGIVTALWLDVSVSGAMASVAGVLFVIVWLWAPRRGVIAYALERNKLRHEVLLMAHLMHLASHQQTDQPLDSFVAPGIAQELIRRGWLDHQFVITPAGYDRLATTGRRL